MKYDNKNLLKLQISTYLEESLGMVGKMMLEDLFDQIENSSDIEGNEIVEAHFEHNVFDLIAPYLQLAAEEYEIYKRTDEGKESIKELREFMDQAKAEVQKEPISVKKIINNNDDNEGNGNVH